MKQLHHFTAVIKREGNDFVALSPELDIASQGNTVEEAKKNLAEAIELFLEAADFTETQSRLLEKIGLAEAICEGRQNKFASEEEIKAILEPYFCAKVAGFYSLCANRAGFYLPNMYFSKQIIRSREFWFSFSNSMRLSS